MRQTVGASVLHSCGAANSRANLVSYCHIGPILPYISSSVEDVHPVLLAEARKLLWRVAELHESRFCRISCAAGANAVADVAATGTIHL